MALFKKETKTSLGAQRLDELLRKDFGELFHFNGENFWIGIEGATVLTIQYLEHSDQVGSVHIDAQVAREVTLTPALCHDLLMNPDYHFIVGRWSVQPDGELEGLSTLLLGVDLFDMDTSIGNGELGTVIAAIAESSSDISDALIARHGGRSAIDSLTGENDGSATPATPHREPKESPPAGRTQDPNDYGLEGFMGRRVPDHERTMDYILSSAPADGLEELDDLKVTQGAWREISKSGRMDGMREPVVRLYLLPCQCGGYQWGIFAENRWSPDETFLSDGTAHVVMDAESVRNTRGMRLNSEGRGDGMYTLGGLRIGEWCECGDNWRPALAVAAAAVTFGIVKRNIAIAEGWLDDNGTYADGGDTYAAGYSDSGSDYSDVGFDFGGF
jgi:hypothetical protein